MLHLGNVPAGTTLYIPFHTFNSSGASVTITGLATTDIEIYKNGSATQRSSDNGYALLDTDGIDFDSITGIHGFSVDLSDNTDSGFYAVGSFYWVVVSSITADSQTVNFVAATFRIVAAEATAGYPVITNKVGTGTGEINLSSGVVPANVTQFGGSNGTFASGRPEVNTTHAAGTAWGSGAITAASIAADAIGASELASDAATEIATAVWASGTRILTALDEDSTTLDLDATIRAAVGMASANLDTQIGDLPTNAELATALGSADDAVLAAIAGVDTKIGTPAVSLAADIADVPTANENADALLDRSNAIETGLTMRQAHRLYAAALAGKLSGGATATNTLRNAVADSKDRMSVTVDADGNRSAITYDLT